SLRDCVDDLSRAGQLRQVTEEVDPRLEMAEIQRRVYAARGPALLFTRVKGTAFPCVSNLFGTGERSLLLLGDGIERTRKLVKLRSDPANSIRHPFQSLGSVLAGRHA